MSVRTRSIAGFELLATGPWPLAKVHAEQYPEPWQPGSPDIAAFIDARWLEACALAKERRQNLFDCDIIGLQTLAPRLATLGISTRTCSYKGYVGTNRNIPALFERFGSSVRLANPLALCVCLRSVDGFLLLGQRSYATYDHPGYFHVPGGHMEHARHLRGNRVNIERALHDELFEELAIPSNLIANVFCTGVLADASSFKPELLLAANLRCCHGRIRRPANEEHGRLYWLRDTARTLAGFIRHHKYQLVPAGQGCLLLYGRMRYGQHWFERLTHTLKIS